MKFFDRVKETSTTTGTGDFTLAGAVTGFRTFSSVLSVNDTCDYCIELQGGSEWEVGEGTYSAANTLTRTTVTASSNSGNAVNFSSGTKNVFLTASAKRFNFVDTSSASPDYALGIGETAVVAYSASSSVALNIATVAGEYELWIQGDYSISSITNGACYLQPNNTTYTSAIQDLIFYGSDGSAGPSGAANLVDAFIIGAGLLIHNRCFISTKTKAKGVSAIMSYVNSGPDIGHSQRSGLWKDSTTAWTSLGTITFPMNQNGTIWVKRLS